MIMVSPMVSPSPGSHGLGGCLAAWDIGRPRPLWIPPKLCSRWVTGKALRKKWAPSYCLVQKVLYDEVPHGKVELEISYYTYIYLLSIYTCMYIYI